MRAILKENASSFSPIRWLIAGLLLSGVLSGCIWETQLNGIEPALIAWEGEDGLIGIVAGEEVTFWIGDDMVSPESATGNATWDFGDGSSADGNPVTHTFAEPGRFLVTARWNGQDMEQSMAVDHHDDFERIAPANPPTGLMEPRYVARTFSVNDGAVALRVAAAATLGPTETLHLRLLGPSGEEILHDQTSQEQIEGTFESPQEGQHEIEIWVDGSIQDKPVHGRISVAY